MQNDTSTFRDLTVPGFAQFVVSESVVMLTPVRA